MKIKLNLRRLRKSNLIIFNGTFKANLSWRIRFLRKSYSTVCGLFDMFGIRKTFTVRTVRCSGFSKLLVLDVSTERHFSVTEVLSHFEVYLARSFRTSEQRTVTFRISVDLAQSHRTRYQNFYFSYDRKNMMLKTFILTNSKWRTFFVTTKILSQRFLSFVHRPTKIIDAWFRKRRSCYLTRFSNCNPSVYETDCSL